MTRRFTVSAACLLLYLLFAEAAASGPISFETVAPPPAAGFPFLFDLSGDGSTIITKSDSIYSHWTEEEGYRELGDLERHLEPVALSADGKVIVGYEPVDRPRPVRWIIGDEGAGFADALSLPNGADRAFAMAASGDGSIVAVSADSPDWEGGRVFQWENGQYRSIGLEELTKDVLGISNDGDVITGVASTPALPNEERERWFYRWTTAGGAQLYEYASTPEIAFHHVSNDGATAFGTIVDEGGVENFRWTTSSGFEPLGGTYLETLRMGTAEVSADGSVILGVDSAFNLSLWDESTGTRRTVSALLTESGADVAGWTFGVNSFHLSDDGNVLVGLASKPDGEIAIWRARFGSGDFVWTGPDGGPSGSWGAGANWDPEGPPSAADSALFDIDESYTVTFESAVATDALTVRAGNVSFATGDSRYDVGRLEVGGGAETASLHVNTTEVITLNEHGVLAEEIVVSSGGSLRNSAQLYVGNVDFPPSGPGANQALTDLQATNVLRVQNGGAVRTTQAKVDGPSSAGPASVDVTGVGAVWEVDNLVVGGQFTGLVNVSDGGELNVISGSVGSPDLLSESVVAVSGASEADGQLTPSKLLVNALSVGKQGRGRLTVENGARAGVDNVVIGDELFSEGAVVIHGEGTVWEGANTPANFINVGRSGKGELLISGGATVSAFLNVGQLFEGGLTHDASVVVEGDGTTLTSPEMQVGQAGTGSLSIISGAKVDSVVVKSGEFLGGNGLISVVNPGSTLTVETRLDLGQVSSGALLASDGAHVEIGPIQGFVQMGLNGVIELVDGGTLTATRVEQSGGSVVVAGVGSKLTSSFGYTADGELTASHGGDVQVEGEALDIRGSVELSSQGVLGAPNVTLRSGGSISVTDSLSRLTADERLFSFPSTQIEVSASGAIDAEVIEISGDLSNDLGGWVNASQRLALASSGFLSVGLGAVTVGEADPLDGVLRIGPGGELAGSGHIQTISTIDFVGGVNNFGGSIQIGSSPGVLTIEGNYEQGVDGELIVEIGGKAAGTEFDVLRVTGDLNVDGLVTLEFIDGFAPQRGDSVEFLDVDGTMDLTEATFAISNLAQGFEYALVASAAGYQLTALNDAQFRFAADFFFDGKVNLLDFNVLKANFGTSDATQDDGDANDDGVVDLADFNGLKRQFGASTAVPEPSTLSVAALGAWALAAASRRRKT